MFKYLVCLAMIAATVAEPGVLSPAVSIAAAPTIVSAPSLGVIRSSPIVLGTTIGAPLTLSGGLVSTGLVSNGLISNGLVSGGVLNRGLVSGKVISGGLISGGLIH